MFAGPGHPHASRLPQGLSGRAQADGNVVDVDVVVVVEVDVVDVVVAGRGRGRRRARRGRGRSHRSARGGEDDVGPVVRRPGVGGVRKAGRRAVAVHAVALRSGGDRAAHDRCTPEVVERRRVPAFGREVRDGVCLVLGERDRLGEVRGLPARRRLTGEVDGREQTAGRGPQVPRLRRHRRLRRLVVPQRGDGAGDAGLEAHTNLHRPGVVRQGDRRSRRRREETHGWLRRRHGGSDQRRADEQQCRDEHRRRGATTNARRVRRTLHGGSGVHNQFLSR